jgi:anti-anti-sigma factor
MPTPFSCQFEFTPDNSAVVIALVGKLDAEAVQELHPQIQEVCQQGGLRRFVFDLSQLHYIGSLGLRLLLGLRLQVKGEGRVTLCYTTPAVQSVLDMMKLKDVLPVYASRDEALEATKQKG